MPTRSSGGAAVVEISAVRALAEGRKAGSGGNAKAVEADPELDAMILARLDEGHRPLDLVRDLRVTPQRVRQLAEELAKLKALERGPRFADQVATVQAELGEQAAKVRALEDLTANLAAALEELNRQVLQRFGDLPLPASRGEFACACGARGYFVVPLRCACCNREQTFGFHPQRPA